MADNGELLVALTDLEIARAELAALRAAVEALADKWDEDHDGSDDCETCWLIQDFRSLLAAAPTETEGENT